MQEDQRYLNWRRLPHWSWLAGAFLSVLVVCAFTLGLLSRRGLKHSSERLQYEVRHDTRIPGAEALHLVSGPCVALSELTGTSEGAHEWEFGYLDWTLRRHRLVIVVTFEDGASQLRNVRMDCHRSGCPY